MKRRLLLISAAIAVVLATGGLYWFLSRPQLVFLGFPGSYIALMMKASSQTGIAYDFWGRRQMEDPKLDQTALLRYKAIFVSGRRSEPFSDALKGAILAAQNRGIRVIVLPADQARPLGVGNADFAGAEQPIERYFHYGGTENMAGLAIGAIVPELDGAIEPTLLEGLDAEWYGKRYEAILDDRIDRLVDRAARWVRLRKTPNSAKKVAVIYVAGVGKGKVVAASLNVPNSMTRFLGGLKDAGYAVSRIPSSPESLIEEMNTKGRNISESQLGDMDELSRMQGVELLPASE